MTLSIVSAETESNDTPRQRTLSKSDFKLSRTCAAKLFFRENGYPDTRDKDPYLHLLAEGGYMVEALAKAHYPDGIQLEYGRDVAAECAHTLEYLHQENVTLFEATLAVGRRQARVDILEKRGNVVRLLEVKAKSFDGAEHAQRLADGKPGALRGVRKPHNIDSKWIEKLEDVTFQMLLLEHLLPGLTITPYLVVVDKSKTAAIDHVPGFFELVQRPARDGTVKLQTARYRGTPDQLRALDLLAEVNVSSEVATLRSDVEEASLIFESRLDAPFAVHAAAATRSSACKQCEFRHADGTTPDGFAECWGVLGNTSPHVLELFSVGTAKAPDKTDLVPWMINAGTTSLLDVPEEGLVLADGSIGVTAQRQRRQIEYTRCGTVFIGGGLAAKIRALDARYPVHCIDFETSRLALPYHRHMRPYGLVAFQWSCHTVPHPGATPVHREWLNDIDIWPNRSFAESLRAAIGDTGPVVTWTHFEGSVLKEIIRDMPVFGPPSPELIDWLTDVFTHRIVDLHEWAKTEYYHPGMQGRTSIKVVLDALWKSDPVMRQQFEIWTGLRADPSSDPYTSLPSIEIAGVPQNVHEGTGAMRAYQEMMYGISQHDPQVRAHWAALLKQYCALDTLSMVLILEHWRRVVSRA